MTKVSERETLSFIMREKSFRRSTRMAFISFPEVAAGEVEEERLEGGALDREEPGLERVFLRERVEGAHGVAGPRAEAMDPVDRRHLAVRGELRRQGRGLRQGREADLLVEGKPREELVFGGEG